VPSSLRNTTRDGTGGGIWQSGAGPASDGSRLHNEGQQYPDCAGPPPQGSNGPPAALHAFCATAGDPNGPCPSLLYELYSSRTVQTQIGRIHGFPTPTVFNGQVYMGTDSEVDVFGVCSTAPSGFCLP
jgi:hypothetical protein